MQLQALVIVLLIVVAAAAAYALLARAREGLKVTAMSAVSATPFNKLAQDNRFVGASSHLVDVLRITPRCPGGSPAVLLSGKVDAYLDSTSPQSCGTAIIAPSTPLTHASLEGLERSASSTCGQRAGWYVVDAATMCDPLSPLATKTFLPPVSTSAPPSAYAYEPMRSRGHGHKEGFFCWGGESSRENFRSSSAGYSGDVDGSDHAGGAGPSDADFCSAGRTKLESRRGFSPDCPGACTNIPSWEQKQGVASNYEYEALRVLNGEV